MSLRSGAAHACVELLLLRSLHFALLVKHASASIPQLDGHAHVHFITVCSASHFDCITCAGIPQHGSHPHNPAVHSTQGRGHVCAVAQVTALSSLCALCKVGQPPFLSYVKVTNCPGEMLDLWNEVRPLSHHRCFRDLDAVRQQFDSLRRNPPTSAAFPTFGMRAAAADALLQRLQGAFTLHAVSRPTLRTIFCPLSSRIGETTAA